MKQGVCRKLILCLLVFCFALVSTGAANDPQVYYNATKQMEIGNYAEAARVFETISGYQDASSLALYCKAWLLAEEGRYGEASAAFDAIGDCRDSKELAVYYDACRLEEEALDAPEVYIDAAERFLSISLFGDSSFRATCCLQDLYDVAKDCLVAGDYLLASSYFQLLGNYSKAPEMLRTAQMIPHFILSPEFDILDQQMNIVHQYDGAVLYLGDKADRFFLNFSLCIENTAPEEAVFLITAEIDADEYAWDESRAAAGDSLYYSFTDLDTPEYFTEGNHNCVWYVNGIPVLSIPYTVYTGISEAWREDINIAKQMKAEIFISRYDRNAAEPFSDLTQESTLLLSALREGGAYVPVFTVTNPLKESVSVFISAVIDGRATTWGEVTLEAADPMHLSSPWFLSAGSHSIQVYVNGIRLADRSFEVVDQ